jgi:trehalose 6-phosphate synthase
MSPNTERYWPADGDSHTTALADFGVRPVEVEGPPRASELVVLANRLPVHRIDTEAGTLWQTSPGGLVSAIQPALHDRNAAWVGWTGAPDDAPPPFVHDRIGLYPIAMSQSEIDAFYAGFSNRTLWPLYHDAIRTPEFRRRWWNPYVEVNRRFAHAAAAAVAEGGSVWVHDYHLQLTPAMIRRLRPDVKIGFFLHIPFPAVELFARLPWRGEIVRGLLGADVVGFQTRLGAQNFQRAARAFSDAKTGGNRIFVEGRQVRAESFPISIDAGHFESLAQRSDVLDAAQHIRNDVGASRKLVLGVDRLDYTKGIDVRLRAIGEMFRRGRVTAEDVVFIQIAVPSRESVDEYAEMRSRIEELVGRINGQYAAPGSVIVHYHFRNLEQEELIAYYRAADIMLVTPLRDGMNLVAKEYVATRWDNTGVLLLSEFTGAASELSRAVIVNPFDIDGVATTLEDALHMPTAELKRRMAAQRRVLDRNDVFHWAARFLGALDA